MLFDYHLHSFLSPDADPSQSFSRIVDQAMEMGVEEICLTDHDESEGNFCNIDMERYNLEYARFMNTNPPIPVKKGIELSVHYDTIPTYEKFLSQHDFDFIIASQHFVDGVDLYLPDFYQDKTVREAYERYLQAMLKTLQSFQHYDVVGHIGYCCKYCGNYQKLPFCYDLFPDLFDAILKTVIQNGKGIELNTSAAKITGGIGTPTPGILRRYLELGGEIITTGSDGHRPGEVGRFLKEGTQALKEMGFRYICTFEKRKPIFHKL